MAEKEVWCDRCGYRCDPDAATTECFYWDCPMPVTRDTRDEFGKILSEALAAARGEDQ